MLNRKKQRILEEYAAQRTTGHESVEEIKQLIRVMGVNFNHIREEEDYD